jgi:hypothetical protein
VTLPSDAPSPQTVPAWTRPSATLVAIKTGHSAAFLVVLGSILWLVWTGITGRRDRSVAVAAVLVGGETAVFVVNGGVCPLTPLAERHGARRGGVSDIFLPDAVARTIPIWSSALVVVAVLLHLRRGHRPTMRATSATTECALSATRSTS